MRKSTTTKSVRKLTALVVFAAPLTAAMASNGLLMEGYAAVATSMGGASQAHDVGNSGMAQNPATLALQPDGSSRLAFNLGMFQPDVESLRVGGGQRTGSGGVSSQLQLDGGCDIEAGLGFA